MSKNSFSTRLAYLRREMGLSQKKAAAELGISQALLSHYERGIRECSLSFLVSAAKFYNVSSDYLLGLTMEKRPAALIDNTGEDITPARRGSLSAVMAKKLVINSAEVIFDIVEKCENRDLLLLTSDYFSLFLYKYFRYLYNAGLNPSGAFTLDDDAFPFGIDNCIILCEMKLLRILSGQQKGKLIPLNLNKLPVLTNDYLTALYPKQASSLLNMLHNADVKAKECSSL
jgi:transcriptional regulator with XRE-family HTH domain